MTTTTRAPKIPLHISDGQGEATLPETGPGPLALGLAKLVRALSPQAVADLERLLVNSIGAPSAAELREARLGLLVEMVSAGDGQIPAVRDYLELRGRRAQAGEDWPTASSLLAAYGSITAAARAAMRLHHDGSQARVPHTHRHARSYSSYTREEVVAALGRFQREHGSWPRSELEFLTWGEALRRAARQGGHPDPRVPTAKPIRKLFGAFGRALTVASASCAY
jgi:hypothetical protein